MALPTATFNTAASGRLQVVFRGTWLVNEFDWGAGDWQLSLRAYVGTGPTRKTSLLGTNTATATIEVPYVGGTNVAVGFEYDSHSYGGAGTICATDLRIACHLIEPGGAPVVTFDGLLQQLVDEWRPGTETPSAAPWVGDLDGDHWYVRPLTDVPGETVELIGLFLDLDGNRLTYPDALGRVIIPGTPYAVSYPRPRDPPGDPIEMTVVIKADGISLSLTGGYPDGMYDLSYDVAIPSAGDTYATAWPGFKGINWASVLPGDTLWVCGTHRESTLNIPASGTPGAYIKVRLDYAPDPARIYQARLIDPSEWIAAPTAGEYYLDGVLSSNNMLFLNAERLVGPSLTSLNKVRITEWSSDDNWIRVNQERRIFLGMPITLPFDINLTSLPDGLERAATYYATQVSFAAARYTFKLAENAALAAIGVALDIGPQPVPGNWFVWLIDEGPAHRDPVPGALLAGQYAYDPPTQRLYHRPVSGLAGLSISNDKNITDGSCIYGTGSYVWVRDSAQWGGLFGTAALGRLGDAHLNGIDWVGGTRIILDGLQIEGVRSGLRLQSTTLAIMRNCRVKDTGWHAVGGEGVTSSEPDMIIERNWVSDVGRKHDFGDTQGFVTNPLSHRTTMRRNYIERCTRNYLVVAPGATGAFVIDSSNSMNIYRNWIDSSNGNQIGSTSGPDGEVNDAHIVGNVITRCGTDLGGGVNQVLQQCCVNFTQTLDGITDMLVAGNLIAFNASPNAAHVAEVYGAFRLRAVNSVNANGPHRVERNAFLAHDGHVYSVQFYSTAPQPTFTADNNLFASVPSFYLLRTALTELAAYTGGQIQGTAAGNWSADTGNDTHSVLAVLRPDDKAAAPTLDQLDLFLRTGAETDSYSTSHRPTLASVGRFPLRDA